MLSERITDLLDDLAGLCDVEPAELGPKALSDWHYGPTIMSKQMPSSSVLVASSCIGISNPNFRP